METTAWIDFVRVGHKHNQMVHHPVGPLGHASASIKDLTRLHTESLVNSAMVSDPVFDNFYDKATAASSEQEVQRIFRDANERVARQHFAISLLHARSYSLCQPWLKGFNAQFGSTWGAAAGPGMLSFYLGRFWIDQNLKKSWDITTSKGDKGKSE